jgi:type III secretion protein V
MLDKVLSRLAAIRNEVIAGNLNSVLTRFSDLLLVGCIAIMVGLMIVPLPTFLLDIFLTVNITLAITVLMVSIYVSSGTQIASYPTLLLLTTLYRLSLEISATRLILLKADAGEVIKAFGMFVVGGNFVVGAVIFLIITLVQFIVITKGAERVAEVSARFTLDAMPGKQMSIDADLRAGTIDFQQARRRRQALSRESQFYGAMDGAMKFVKGDAIAGIIITVINIVGGLIIGVAMNGMSALEAVQTYSILTIGDGLVSQIPALLISISAGMVVTRVASEDESTNLGKDIAGQILAQPKAIGVASGILLVIGLIPGLPKIPFLILAGITGSISYGLFNAMSRKRNADADDVRDEQAVPKSSDPEVTLTIPLVMEVGQEIGPFVDIQKELGKVFYEKLVQLRNSLYGQLGVIFPPIRISVGTTQMSSNYRIWLDEVPIVPGRIRTDSVLVNSSAQNLAVFGFKGENTVNPATSRPACWISRAERERAEMAGLQVWDTHEVLLLHMAKFLREHAKDFVGVQETQWMLDTIKQYYPKLVDEVVPKPVSLQQLTEILQRLVEEEVSIRNLKAILQALSEWGRTERDTPVLVEYVRAALRDRICYQLTDGKPRLFVYTLDVEIEDVFRNSIRQNQSGAYLAMESNDIQRILEAVRSHIGNLPATAQRPVVLVDAELRRFVKKLIGRAVSDVQTISYDQLTPEINVQPLGTIAFASGTTAEDGGVAVRVE